MDSEDEKISQALEIASKDNGVELQHGAIFFTTRKGSGVGRNPDSNKSPQKCAFEFAEMHGHKFMVKHQQKKKDHWLIKRPLAFFSNCVAP